MGKVVHQSVDSDLRKYVNIQLPNGSLGEGNIVCSTLSALQSTYPNGLNSPVWVTSEKSWYYWDGVLVEPNPTPQPDPTDTTPPILSITPSSSFTTTQTVTMTTNETATIYYTLDDTDPKTSGTKLTYATPLTLTATDTVKAYARDTSGNESVVQTITYTKQTGVNKLFYIDASVTKTSETVNRWRANEIVPKQAIKINEIGIYASAIPSYWELWALDSNGAFTGSVIKSGSTSNWVDNGDGYYKSTIAGGVNLTANTRYALEIRSETASTTRYLTTTNVNENNEIQIKPNYYENNVKAVVGSVLVNGKMYDNYIVYEVI